MPQKPVLFDEVRGDIALPAVQPTPTANTEVPAARLEHGPEGTMVRNGRALVGASTRAGSALALYKLVGFFRQIAPEFRMAFEC